MTTFKPALFDLCVYFLSLTLRFKFLWTPGFEKTNIREFDLVRADKISDGCVGLSLNKNFEIKGQGKAVPIVTLT